MTNNFTEIQSAISPVTNPVVNDFLASLDSCCLQPIALARPTHYSISVSVVCDIKCPYCARQTYTELVESGLMKLEQFKQLAEDLKFARLVALYGLGEPLLHPQFFEFVRLVKAAGGYAATSSHGMTLTPEVIGKILDSGLDELEISIDATDQKLFNYLRRGADLPTIIKNVENLQREKQRRGIRLPKVQIACAISVYNLKEIPKIVRLASQLHADNVVFSNLIVSYPADQYASICPSATFQRAIDEAKKLGQRLGIGVHYFYQKPHPWQREIFNLPLYTSDNAEPVLGYGCPLAYRHFFVNLKGFVTPCCYFAEYFGNCFTELPAEIINNARFRQLRQELIEGNLPACCVDCGSLMRITPSYLTQKLAEAEQQLDNISNQITEQELAELKKILTEYRQIANQRIEQYQTATMEIKK